MLENQGIFSMKQGIQSHYYENYEREQTSKEKEESKTAATFDK